MFPRDGSITVECSSLGIVVTMLHPGMRPFASRVQLIPAREVQRPLFRNLMKTR